MRTLMTCDQAFETLTAGPVDLGSDRAAKLNEHLRACGSCRDLADALRPACHLLHEALAHEQRLGLPVVLSAHDAHVGRIMSRVGDVPITRPRRINWTGAGAALAMSACVLVLLIPWGGMMERRIDVIDVSRTLASLQLPAACELLKSSEHAGGKGPDIAAAQTCEDCHQANQPVMAVNLVCCTECHASGSARRPLVEDKTSLLLACGTCHSPLVTSH